MDITRAWARCPNFILDRYSHDQAAPLEVRFEATRSPGAELQATDRGLPPHRSSVSSELQGLRVHLIETVELLEERERLVAAVSCYEGG